MLEYIVGLATIGLIGSLLFQGRAEQSGKKLPPSDTKPNISDYQVPSLSDEESKLLRR